MTDPLYTLQMNFLTTGKGLDLLFLPLETLAKKVLFDTMKQKGFRLSEDRIEDVVQDSTTTFIEVHFITSVERTRAKPIVHFYPMMRWSVHQQLGYARRGKYSKQKHWDQTLSIHAPVTEDGQTFEDFLSCPDSFTDIEEPLTYIRELADHSPWVPYLLYKEKDFETAIRKIITIGGELWTRTNWVRLHQIWTVLKRSSGAVGSLRAYCKSLKTAVKNTDSKKRMLSEILSPYL